ncbi:MAG: thymidine phosphorylase family protein [Nanoarchaeota archaeon]
MFKAKRIEIVTLHEYIAIMHEKDAQELGFGPKDRIRITNEENGKVVICELQIFDGLKRKGETQELRLNRGEIGLFNVAFERLEIAENKNITTLPAKKPYSLEYVKEKFRGKSFTYEQLQQIMLDIVENRYSPVESTYFVIACSEIGLSDEETISLTKAMVGVGKILDFREKQEDVIVDKHCIGGIPGNRTTMVVIPIIAAAGLKIPKTSSRSITSPAGTADTMEVLANVSISLNKMHSVVEHTNGCIVWGGGLDLSPADDIIIQVEHPLEIDSEGQMIASILSKKKSVGSTHVLLDIPIGPTAKVNSKKEALRLKKRFEKIGKAVGLKIKTLITDGSEPIGHGIGPYLEALDVLMVLKNESPKNSRLREKSLVMAGEILEMSGVTKKGFGYALAQEFLESGKALKKFEEIRNAQGRKDLPKPAKFMINIYAPMAGRITGIHNKRIAKLAFILGAPQDKVAGILFSKKTGEIVGKEDILATLYTNSELKLKYAQAYIEENFPFMIEEIV